MRKKLFASLMGFGLCSLTAAALEHSVVLCEIDGPLGAFKSEATIRFDGTTFTMSLNRLTGWKIASVYQVESLQYARYFNETQTDLDSALKNGKIVRETGWTESGTTLTCPYKAPYVVVCYEPYQYTIAFNANASSVGGTMASQTGLSYTNTATTLRPNAFTRTGYVFKGWTTTSSGLGTVFADKTTVGGERFGVAKDGQTVTLYAKWSAQSYKVSCSANGGTADSSWPTSATYDATFKVSAPTRTGYTFLGWTVSEHDANTAQYGTSSSSVASTLPSGGQITASGDVWLKNLTPTAGATVTLTARWTAKSYTITYNEAGGTAGSSRPKSATYDAAFKVSAPTRTGYTFLGWTVSGHDATTARYGTSSSSVASTLPSGGQITASGDIWLKNLTSTAGATVTLTARWSERGYKVAYNEADGTAGASRPTAVAYDTAFQVSAPTRTGYTFQGWTVSGHDATTARYGTSSSSVASTLPSGGQITASGDIWLKNLTPTAGATVTLTARWKVITCRVTFSAEGGRNGTASIDIDYGQTASGFATISSPERANYTFQGYYTQQEGKGACYFDQNGYLLKTWDIAATACTLYAYWTATSYIVTFDSNGGKGTVVDRNVTYTETFSLPSGSGLTPPSDGQSFGGWALGAHATAAAYSAGQQTSLSENSQYLSGGKLTFYAYWQDNTRTIAVYANGGTASSNSFTVVIGQRYDARGPLPTATWGGGKKLFAGWYTAADGGMRVQASDRVPQSVPSTLYAHWTNSAYIVRFDGNGQTSGVMADQTIPFNESVALTSNAFSRTGYTFAGWAQTNTPTRVSFNDGAPVKDLAARAGDVVRLLAVWTTNTYYVAFDANGGEGTMSPLTNLYDRAFTLPANRFTRSGFWGFSEWRDVATGQAYAEGAEVVNLTNMPFATVTLQAVWTNSLSSLSRAMHCDNLDWQNDSADGNLWQVYEGSGVGHGSDSCVRQSNRPLKEQQSLVAELEPRVQGTLSFWWKPTGAATKLMYVVLVKGNPQAEATVVAEKDIWTNVVIRIERDEKADDRKVCLRNATTSGEGFCCIDGMTWTPDGENPTPGESDRVEVASFVQTANGLALSFTGDTRFAYHLRAADSLQPPVVWYDFGATNVGTGAAQTFDIPFDAAAPQRFFRIETIQKPTP